MIHRRKAGRAAAAVLAACLLFGSGFAFYAMFAAIAVELIGAVYYTFQLK